MSLIHKKIDSLPKLLGFATENVPAHGIGKFLCKTFSNSDDADFYNQIDGVTSHYFNKVGANPTFVHNFLILHHSDFSVDIYLNDLPIKIEMLSKKNVVKGQLVYESDIADIRRLNFTGITVKDTDNVIFGFKYGWRYGLFFDLSHLNDKDPKLNVNRLYFELGSHYRSLAFYYLYQTVEKSLHFEEMLTDGWFPYIELIGKDYRELIKAYENKFDYPNKINNLLDTFNQERITKLVTKWWKNPLFLQKKDLLEAGIEAYLQNNKSGYINAIKNLYTEIEGVLGITRFQDKQEYTNKTRPLTEHIAEVGLEKTGDGKSLLLPEHFSAFLSKYFFANFAVETGDTKLSRHSSSHGVAQSAEFNKIRALQAILILDQIFFYLPKLVDEK